MYDHLVRLIYSQGGIFLFFCTKEGKQPKGFHLAWFLPFSFSFGLFRWLHTAVALFECHKARGVDASGVEHTGDDKVGNGSWSGQCLFGFLFFPLGLFFSFSILQTTQLTGSSRDWALL